MLQLFYQHAAKIRIASVVLIALQLSACGSPEERAQRYYESGQTLLAAHEDAKAAVEFRNALRLKKDFLPAWRGLAQIEEAAHHAEGLIPVLRTILDLDPKDKTTRVKLASLLLAAGAVDRALKLVNEMDEPDANDASILALKAFISTKLKDNDAAVRYAQAALKIEPGNVGALVVLANDRLANNDPNGALQLLSTNPETQDKDLGTQLFKLRIYDRLKDYAQLESLLRKLADNSPKNPAFRKQLANLYGFQHRPEDAERELRAIVALDPKNVQANVELIRFLFTVKGPAAAHDELVTLINAGGDVFPYQLALAVFEFDQGQVDDSFKLLETLGNSAPSVEAVKAKITLAELNLRRKNRDEAEKIADDILASDQRNVEALKLRASIRLDHNQVDAAISDLREALNEQPRSPEIMLMLASAYEHNGSIDLADKQYADATRASKFNPNVGLDYVGFLRRRGGGDRAYDVLTELANRSPNNVQVLSALADAKLQRQDWVGAQQIADMIKHIGNSGVVADEILGAALSGENKYDASIAALQNAVTAAPTAVQPMVNLVTTMLKAKQTDQAIAFLQSVLKQNPSNAQAYVLLGNIELSNNKPDQAEKDFKAAIGTQPKNDVGYQALTNLYLRQNKSDAAMDVTRTGLKEQPDSSNLHLAAAGILERKGDYDGAISEYETMLKQQPGSLVVVNNLASILADHRTDKESLDRAQSLAASLRESQIPQFKDTLGWLNYRRGDFKAAVPLLEEAAAALPNAAMVHYHLGMSYIGIGQPAKASDQFKLALSKSPDSDLEAKIKGGLKNIVSQ